MDTPDPHPHRLENFQAWQLARTLAVRAYRATRQPSFKEHTWLADAIRCAATDAPCNLARGHETPRGRLEREFHFQIAKSECARLQTLLTIAADLGLLSAPDGTALHEGCESTRRLIGAVLKSCGPSEDDTPAFDKLKPSASRGPSRRPPSSDGGSRGDAPWDSRS